MDLAECYEPSKLDNSTLAVAKKELNEKDPETVKNDIEYIRNWLNKQSHIKSKVDDKFLLKFLRGAKFSYLRAQQLIENYWTHRTEMKELFYNRNFNDDSVLMEIAELGLCVPLPNVDDKGRRVILNRIGKWDTLKYEFEDTAKYIITCIEMICEDPRVQINGVVVFMDMQDLNAGHATNMTPARAQKLMKTMQDTLPMRIKELHYYNYPKIFDAIFPVVKAFMKEKIKQRLHFHGSDLSSVYKYISKNILPKEYNGSLDSIQELNENWVKFLTSKKTFIEELERYGIDESKLSDKKNTKKTASNDSSGLSGTFKKLNVD